MHLITIMPVSQLHFLPNKNAELVNCITIERRVALLSGSTVHSLYTVVKSLNFHASNLMQMN